MSKKRHAPKFDTDYLSSLVSDINTHVAQEESTPQHQDMTGPAALIDALTEDAQIPGVIPPDKPTDLFRADLKLIHHYDHNPRIATHNDESIQSLAWSIFTAGLINPITITKRPHEPFFIVAKGGNGRLRALNYIADNYNELASRLPEGTPARPLTDFIRPTTRFEPYTTEIAIFEAHLDENLEREDTLWADTANALSTLKAMTEQTIGKELSAREFSSHLEASGRFKKIRSNETISRAIFTMKHLAPVIVWHPQVLVNSGNSISPLRQTHRDCLLVYSTFHDATSPEPFHATCLAWTEAFCKKEPQPSTEPTLFASELATHWIEETEKAIGLDKDQAAIVWANHRNNRPGGAAFRHPDWASLTTPVETGDTSEATQHATDAPATPELDATPIETTTEATSAESQQGEAIEDGATSTNMRQRVSRTERLLQLRTSMGLWRTSHPTIALPQPVADLVEHIASEEDQDKHPLLAFLSSAHQDSATQSLAQEIITYLRVLTAHSAESAEATPPAPTDQVATP